MPFKKGQSGNPKGKPPGARNKSTLLLEQMFDDDAKSIGKKAIELAKNGDATALRLCLDRLMPVRRDRHIAFELPKIENPSDAARAASVIIAAVAAGEITPSEAADLTKLVEGYTRILAESDHEERLRKLEAMTNGNGSKSS